MRSIFPLHLTSFENYMLFDDSVDNPMTFVVEFSFSGGIDREALDKGMVFAIDRHPLLHAIIRKAKGGLDCWVESDTQPRINWGNAEEPIRFETGESIDLRQEPGLRVWVRSDGNSAKLTAQFHHAVCDGIGSYQFLGDLLWKYATETSSQQLPELPALDPVELRARAVASYDPQKFRRSNGKFRNDCREILHLAVRRQHLLGESDSESRAVFPGIYSHSFSKQDYKQLRLVGVARGQATNDLLTAHLFDAIRDWNSQHGITSRRQKLAVMIPMSLREPNTPAFSATNCVAYAFLRRNVSERDDPQKFRESLALELSNLKHQRHATSFMNLCASIRSHPKMANFILGRNYCLASAVLSNTGDPTRSFYVDFPRQAGKVICGNLVLEELTGVPPMRAETNVTVSVFTYARCLQVSLRCNPNKFSDEDTRAFRDLYVEHIQRDLAATINN